MNSEAGEIIKSLSGNEEEIIEFLPRLLKDLWELGGSTEIITSLIKRNIPMHKNMKILDLGCGKGANLITLSKMFGCTGTGVDLFAPFIDEAKKKSEEFGTTDLLEFFTMDIRDAVNSFSEFDIVIYGSDADIFGNDICALNNIKKCCSTDGYIYFDTAVKYPEKLLEEIIGNGFKLIEKFVWEKDTLVAINNSNNEKISRRVNELKVEFPGRESLFDNYLQSQLAECFELENELTVLSCLFQRN